MIQTMKTLFTVSLLAGASLSISAQTAFTVKGNVKDTSRNGEKVTLSYFNGVKKIYTGAVIKNGTYTIEGTVMEPAKAALSINIPTEQRGENIWVSSEKVEFFIEGGVVTVDGLPLAKATVKATGKPQKDLLVLQKRLRPLQQKEKETYNAMLNAAVKKDSINVKKYKQLNEQCKLQIDSLELVFLKAHPASFVSLGLLRERVTAKSLAEDREKMSAMFERLAAPLKQTIVGKEMAEQIKAAYTLGPGKPAVDFVLNDTLGNPVRLSSFKGKYVLLDFWASWCIPCRYENPTVVKAYDKYKDKNFTVLSVSLEQPDHRKDWVAAIKKDGLTWTQVATLTKEEADQIRKLYAIQTIPMNYLIDPKGNIVAVHLRGEALLKKLEEVL
jgi:thiol-disulfide isomerase/thioredoxin